MYEYVFTITWSGPRYILSFSWCKHCKIQLTAQCFVVTPLSLFEVYLKWFGGFTWHLLRVIQILFIWFTFTFSMSTSMSAFRFVPNLVHH